MTWSPRCPRCKRPTPITVGDASGPHGCRECRDDAPESAKAATPVPEQKPRKRK